MGKKSALLFLLNLLPLCTYAYSAEESEEQFIILYDIIALVTFILSFVYFVWGKSRPLAILLMGLNALVAFPAIHIITTFAFNGGYILPILLGLAGFFMPLYALVNKKQSN